MIMTRHIINTHYLTHSYYHYRLGLESVCAFFVVVVNVQYSLKMV